MSKEKHVIPSGFASFWKGAGLQMLLILLPFLARAQSETPHQKSVFLELAGSGGLASINYERQFRQREQTALSWRAGFSFSPIDKNNGTALIFPLMLHAMIGKSAHKLELGVGQGFTLTTRGNFFVRGIAGLGYRYQSKSGRWFYRLTYTPLISYLLDVQVQHWGGLSIGYTLPHSSK